MRNALKIVRTAVWIAAAAGLGASSLAAQNSTAVRWRPWEQELISTADFTAASGNPYRDLTLKVQYWRRTGAACGAPVTGGDGFVSYGFWEGGTRSGSTWTANNKRFLIRSTFPDGVWCWKTTCNRILPDGSPSSTAECSGDAGLNKTGQVTVSVPNPAPANRLWALGLPKVSANKRSVVYGDGSTQFPWLGDTAWDAPINYGNGNRWLQLVGDRDGKGFSTILIAPATQTSTAVPTTGFGLARGDCSTAEKSVVPNRCTKWDGFYWEQFDELVSRANATANGIVPIVAGVMDPTVRGGANNNLNTRFPSSVEAKVFARNLAARLAGYHVVFSPSYDAKTTPTSGVNLSVDNLTVLNLVKAVGGAIRSAAPRHLVGAHLAGSNPLPAYLDLQGETWISLQLFQSGHGGSNAGAPCNISGTTDLNDFQRSVCRAREGALEFRCIGTPTSPSPGALPVCDAVGRTGTVLPAVNVEGEYESAYVKSGTALVRDLNNLPVSRSRSRHTGWVTALSGSFGFHVGHYTDLTAWSNPSAYSDGYAEGGITHLFKSDNDLKRMNAVLAQSPWTALEPWHKLLADFSTLSEENRRHLAVARPVAIAHVPAIAANATTTTVNIARSGPFATVRCPAANSGVSVVWTDPRGWGDLASLPNHQVFPDVVGKCEEVGTNLKITTAGKALGCSDNRSSCDWVVRLTSNAIASGSAPLVAAHNATLGLGMKRFDLRVWTQIDAESESASVIAETVKISSGATGTPFKVNADEARMRSLPTATKDSNGNFLVVWQQAGDDGTDDVYAVQVSQAGVVQGDPFPVNTSSENQNGEPSVTSDLDGNSIVTWTESAQDGTLGNVWMRTYDASGEPATDPVLVAGGAGNQKGSKVQVDGAGNVLVVWSSDPEGAPIPTEPGEGDPLPAGDPVPAAGVYLRKLLLDGTPLAPALALHATTAGVDSVVDLEVESSGDFTLVWETDLDGEETDGYFEQDFDADGAATTAMRVAGGS